MTGFLGAEIGMIAGACGLLLVNYWDDISSAFGPHDGRAQADDDTQDQRGAIAEMTEGAGDTPGSDDEAGAPAKHESTARESDAATEADTGNTGDDTQPGFLPPDSLDTAGIAIITNFNPETDIITLQYDGAGSGHAPEITIFAGEDGASSEIRVNGKTYGIADGVRDLDAGQVALVDVGDDTGGAGNDTGGHAPGDTGCSA